MSTKRFSMPASNGLAQSGLRDDVEYTMTFRNHSDNAWNFCCYQNDPAFLKANPGSLPAAWFVKQTVHPTTVVTFSWRISYGLCWSQVGTINPGIIYNASQNWEVSPGQNMVTLTKEGGSYTFEDQRNADPPSVYQIYQAPSVVKQDGVGIGISMQVTGTTTTGLSPVYVQAAQPNVTTQFAITPRYWVTFSQSIKPSQILDVNNIVNAKEIAYPPGVYAQVVTLDQQNQWHVSSQADLNRAFVARHTLPSSLDLEDPVELCVS